MNKSIKAIGVFFASLALGSVATAGEVAPVDPVCSVGFTGSVSVGYDTDLYHRGLNLGENVISAGVNTSHDIAGIGVDLGVSYENITENITEPAVGDRLVTSAWTSLDVLPIDTAIGLNWYYYAEGAWDDSLELGIHFSEDIGFATVDFGYYYDTDSDGNYIQGGLSKTIALGDCLDLNLGAGIGYGDEDYTAGNGNGGEHVYVRAGLAYSLTETATLNAYIAGNFAYGDLEELVDEEDEVYGGVSLSVSF